VTETFAADSSLLTQGFHQTNLTIVAVNDPMADFQVQVYPNPTAGWVNIESQASTPAFSVEVSDAAGRTLLIQSAAQQGLLRSLDLSGYAPGVYYLRLRTEDQKSTQTFKVIKHN
jgi:bacillolysin